jgi:hypothetical protein
MIKKTFIACLLTFAISISLSAMKIEGLIIRQNDTLRLTFKIPTNMLKTEPNFEDLQRSILYYDINGKKNKIKPKDAEEIQFTMNNELIRILSRKMNYNTNKRYLLDSVMFLKLEADGYLKLFSFRTLDMGNISKSKNSYLLQKGTDELKWINAMRVKNDLIEYLADCSSSVEMINKCNFFFMDDLVPIVNFYNGNCAVGRHK